MQAARGTSVAVRSGRHEGSRTRFLVGFAAVAVTAYAIDQVSKAVAVAKLEGRPDVSVVGDLLRLHLTRNPGAAFSLGTDATPVLTCLAIAAAVAVLWYARRLGSAGWAVALGFLLAGITGNLTDRIVQPPKALHGEVVDFLRLPNWPIFNVADICINIAAVLIVVLVWRGVRVDGLVVIAADDDVEPTGSPATDDQDEPT